MERLVLEAVAELSVREALLGHRFDETKYRRSHGRFIAKPVPEDSHSWEDWVRKNGGRAALGRSRITAVRDIPSVTGGKHRHVTLDSGRVLRFKLSPRGVGRPDGGTYFGRTG